MKKESLIVAAIYTVLMIAFLALILVIGLVFIGTSILSMASGINPYAGGITAFFYQFLLFMGIIIVISFIFSPLFSVVLVQGLNDARKQKFDLNSMIARIQKRYFPLLGIEIISGLFSILLFGALVLIVVILAWLGGTLFGAMIKSNPLIAVLAVILFIILAALIIIIPYLLVYPFLMIVCIPAVLEDNSIMKTISKTIDLVKKNYRFNLKAVMAFMTTVIAFIILTLILGFVPLIGGIISWPLSILFSVYSIHYAIGLYELNQK